MIIFRWWKELDFEKKLPYVRDRIVESFFWALIVYYEPCHSHARLFLCKIVEMMTVVDDTYDAYATIDELTLFTNALQR